LPRASRGAALVALLIRLRATIALVLLTVAFCALSPEFLTTSNLSILVKHVAINAILAIGMTFVILSGGIDLSVGSVAGLCGMVAGGLLGRGLVLAPLGVVVYPHTWLVVVLGLAGGMALGALNGWVVARLRVAPFIARLGLLYAARGAALLMSDGATFPNLAGEAALGNTGFTFLGAGSVHGLPVPVWLMAAIAAAAAFVAARTPFGRHV
jgi:erythritol transport system permease protein